MEEKNVSRFPRPLGTTALAIQYNNDKTEANKQVLCDYIIHSWVLNNGKFGDTPMDINSLSKNLGISVDYIQLYMRDQVLSLKIWQPEIQNDLINGLLGQQLTWALEDRMEVNQQIELLKNSQGGHYTPFISAELNKALKLRLDTSTSLQQIVRQFIGSGGTTNIFMQQNNTNVHQENYIGREEAIELITENGNFLENKSEQAKYLEQAYDIKQLPQIVANEDDENNYGQSFNVNRQELNEITDDYKNAIKLSSKERHEMRREIDMNIDPDSEDPEFDSFEEIPDDDNINISESFLNS